MSDSSEEISDDNVDFLSDDNENEVLPSEDSDSDDDDDLGDDNFRRFQIERKKDEMASDLENDDDEDDFLPNSQAWGKDKKSYYHTDYVDKDFRGQKPKDEDLAQYEEEEALQIQKRLLGTITEQDLGIDLLLGNYQKHSTKTTIGKELLNERKIDILPSVLSESQKIAIIKQESPELELLVSDFEKYLSEIQNELKPLVSKLIDQKAPSSSGLKFLKFRLMILINYCTNIAFYLSLKCSKEKMIVKNHPIIKRLFTYKKMISEVDSCLNSNSKFVQEINFVKNPENQKLRFDKDLKIARSVDNFENRNEPKAIDDEEQIIPTENEKLTGEEKRAITYEMEKNKGLTPKRKREQRNPRVKYRRKFESAVIRRKGQVREPRKELKKYGGEITGINVHAIKSVKFK